ncbi:hypothetical protein ACVIM9_008415 [Bradyrhizobium sp. USDA 4520]
MCSQSVASNYEAPNRHRDVYHCSAAVYVKIDREASPIAANVLLRFGKCAAVDLGLSVLPSDENPAREAREGVRPKAAMGRELHRWKSC